MVKRGNYGKYSWWVCVAIASFLRYSIDFCVFLFYYTQEFILLPMIPVISAPCLNFVIFACSGGSRLLENCVFFVNEILILYSFWFFVCFLWKAESFLRIQLECYFVVSLLISANFVSFAAGILNWSLISFINLTTSLVLRFTAPKRGTALRFWT